MRKARRHRSRPVLGVSLASKTGTQFVPDALALDPAGVRVGCARRTKLLFQGPPHKRRDVDVLGSTDEIALFRQRELALRERAERREVEARVRHLNLDFALRLVLGFIAVGIGICMVIGVLASPALLRASLVTGSAWGVIAASAFGVGRLKPRASGDS